MNTWTWLAEALERMGERIRAYREEAIPMSNMGQ